MAIILKTAFIDKKINTSKNWIIKKDFPFDRGTVLSGSKIYGLETLNYYEDYNEVSITFFDCDDDTRVIARIKYEDFDDYFLAAD